MNLEKWGDEQLPAVAFHTLGCKVNQYESEAMMDLFKKAGYRIVDFSNKADIYVIHSCTVTNEAARKSRQFARRARRKNPEAKVALVGCYPQVSPQEVAEIEEVDFIVGTGDKKRIVELITDDLVEKETEDRKFMGTIADFRDLALYQDLQVSEFREMTRAYVKIEDGCNQFCSYCIIPYARGPVRSRTPESVCREVERLINDGVQEIVLTGIHLGAYGTDRDDKNALTGLIRKLLEIGDSFRIRLSSIEVTEVSAELLQLMAEEDRVCPHLHLPLQSGSDPVLKAMNRPYRTGEFRQKTAEIREIIPDIAFTTDVIVGFPGETGKNFRETVDFIEEIGFSRLHVFPFSRRTGTPAAKMSDQVDGDIKKERSNELINLNQVLMLNYQQQFIGERRRVVIEEKRDYETGLLTGFTGNYIKILIDAGDELMGKLVDVKLIDSYSYENACGEIIADK